MLPDRKRTAPSPPHIRSAPPPRGGRLIFPLLRLESHRQNHIEEPVAAVGGIYDAGRRTGIQANLDLLGGSGLQSIQNIAVIEAYLKTLAVAFNGTHVLGLAKSGRTYYAYFIVAKGAAKRILDFIVNNEADTLNAAGESPSTEPKFPWPSTIGYLIDHS